MNRTETAAKRSPLFADAMLFLAVLGWAVSFPIAKLAMNDWGGYKNFFLAGRFWLAFAIFGMLALRNCSWQKLIAHAKPGFWVGITLVLAFNFQYKALSIGSSGEVAFITALSSVLVPVGMWIVFKKRARLGMWVGLIVATVGAILVNYTGSFSFDHAGWLALLGAIGIAAYIILVGHFMGQKVNGERKYEKVPFLTVQFLVLAATTTLLSVLTEVSAKGMPAWSDNAIFGMVFMAVVATAGAFFIQTKYQSITSPERAALVFTLESPLAGLFGYLLLAEAFTSMMMVGAALIFAGVAFAEVLAARESGRGPKEPEEPQGPPGVPFAEPLAARRPVPLMANALPSLPTTTQPCHGVSE